MSMKWHVPDAIEQQMSKPPSAWIYLGLFVMIELIAVAITILQWPKGQPTMSREFLMDVLLAPALLWLGLSCMIYGKVFEDARSKAKWWNLLCQSRFSKWQHWARAHLVLIDSAVLTPEKLLAQRMLGLAPSPPINPEKPLQINGIDASVGKSRAEQVLESLLTQLAGAIGQASRDGDLEVLLHAADEAQTSSVEQAWRNLQLPGQPQVTCFPFDGESASLDTWFAAKELPDYRLVIALQLHDPDNTRAFSEAAVAMLFTTPKVLARSKDLKAQACIMRPIFAESDTAEAALATLLRAEQAPQKKIRQLWFTHLSSLMKNATLGAVREAELNVREQDLDRAIGMPGPVTGWLIQALAAEMVQHSQGAQLVITPRRNGAAFNLVGVAPAPVTYPPEQDVPLLSLAWMFSMMFLSLFVLCLHKAVPSVMSADTAIWLCIAFMLLILFQWGIALFDREHVTQLFNQRFG